MKNSKRVYLLLIFVIISMFLFTSLNACASAIEFKVDFIVDGEVYKTINTSGNMKITMPNNPTKEGYTFDGWYWDENEWKKPFTANSLLDAPLSSDMKVFAHFIVNEDNAEETNNTQNNQTNKKILNFMVDNNVYYSADVSDINNITMPKDPEKEYYTFDGWYWDENTWQKPFSIIDILSIETKNMKVYAKFTGLGSDYSGRIGATKPISLTANTPVNDEMSPYEMMLAAIDNYYNAEYAANICVKGGVSTKIPGLGDVNQGVQSLKVRQGKASDSNVRYFAYSKSMGIANMAEEYYNDGDTIYHRKAEKISKGTDDQSNQRAIIKSWKDTTEYENLEKFKDATSTDFTKIWLYDVNENTVTKESKEGKVTHNEKEGYYTFKVAIDVAKEAAIHDYVEVMKYHLTSNMGMEVTSLTFTNLEFEFSVWDNGFIRYLAIQEAYDMNVTMGSMIKINLGIENNYMNEYSFDKNEKIPYDDGSKIQNIQELDFAGLVALF